MIFKKYQPQNFKDKQELLAAIVVSHLEILHRQIIEEVEKCPNPVESLKVVLVKTLQYFQAHQGLIKLFFMQIGYGNATATEQLRDARQTYRNILRSIIENGIDRGIFLSDDILDISIALNSIIGTINWSLYDLLVIKEENIEANRLADKLWKYLLRSLESH